MHTHNDEETMRDMLNTVRRLKKSLDEEKINKLINEDIEATHPSSDAHTALLFQEPLIQIQRSFERASQCRCPRKENIPRDWNRVAEQEF